VGSAGLESYDDLNVTKETYLRLLRQYAEREIYAGTTLVGAHKDDFEIDLGGNSARTFASQGQQRSLALALKLAEGEIIKKECGEYPVFLLDDVLSELDSARRSYLIEEIRNKQVIMTTCELDPTLYPTARIIEVENGQYREIEN
jgi:DNA replication and repair protein RecF